MKYGLGRLRPNPAQKTKQAPPETIIVQTVKIVKRTEEERIVSSEDIRIQELINFWIENDLFLTYKLDKCEELLIEAACKASKAIEKG